MTSKPRGKAPKSPSPRAAAVQKTVTLAERQKALKATRAEELLSLIARKKRNIVEAFYEIGEALAEIHRKKMYVSLGYGSFGELLEARKVLSEAQARKLVAIATQMTREQALSMGTEKAYALVRYAEESGDTKGIAGLLDGGAVIGKKPVASASAEEIAEATRKLRSKTGAVKKSDPERAQKDKLAAEVQKALRARGAKDARVSAKRAGAMWRVVIDVAASDAAVVVGKATAVKKGRPKG